MLRKLNYLSHGLVGFGVLSFLYINKLAIIEKNSKFKLNAKKIKNINSGYRDSIKFLIKTFNQIILKNNFEYAKYPIFSENIDLPSYYKKILKDQNVILHYKENYFYFFEKSKNIGYPDGLYEFFNAFWLLPFLYSIRNNHESGNSFEFIEIYQNKKKIFEILYFLNWATKVKSSRIYLNTAGRFIFSKLLNSGVTYSYLKLLSKIDQLLIEKNNNLFHYKKVEKHIDRKLNVLASSFLHQPYFEKTSNLIAEEIEKNINNYKKIILVDTGCGDGSLLKKIRELLKLSISKDLLNRVYFCCVDLNPIALNEAKSILGKKNTFFIEGDISDPYSIKSELDYIFGKSKKNLFLHMRTFLDHNRTFLNKKINSNNHWSKIKNEFVGSSSSGVKISFVDQMKDLSFMLSHWSKILNNSKIYILEVFCIPWKIKQKNFETSESLSFEILHNFSNQYLIEPHIFYLSLAENSLFSEKFGIFYPRNLPNKRISIDSFIKKPYFICLLSLELLKDFKRINKNNALIFEEAITENYEMNLIIINKYTKKKIAIFFEVKSNKAISIKNIIGDKRNLDLKNSLLDFCSLYFFLKLNLTIN